MTRERIVEVLIPIMIPLQAPGQALPPPPIPQSSTGVNLALVVWLLSKGRRKKLSKQLLLRLLRLLDIADVVSLLSTVHTLNG